MNYSKLVNFLSIAFYTIGILTCIVFLNFKIPNSTTQSSNPRTEVITTSKTVEIVKYKYIDPNLFGFIFISIFSVCVIIRALYAYRKTTSTNQQRTLK